MVDLSRYLNETESVGLI